MASSSSALAALEDEENSAVLVVDVEDEVGAKAAPVVARREERMNSFIIGQCVCTVFSVL